MNKNNLQTYYHLMRSLGQLLALIKLYNLDHVEAKKKFQQVFAEINKLILKDSPLIFSESSGVFLINGESIGIKDTIMKRFTESFHNLQLGSLKLESGFSLEEFIIFMRILTQKEPIRGEDRIKQYLKEKGIRHIIPLFVTYKMVGEDETVIKEGKIIEVDNLPPEVINRFLQDLKSGEVVKRIKEEEKAYQFLAHESSFLCKKVFDFVKGETTPEEIVKILWTIGEYLLGEINSARQQEINCKILDGLKHCLLSTWEQVIIDKEHFREEIQKTFAAINAALELKGLLSLYKMHNKSLKTVASKIKNILETLPPESQLYKKTKEELDRITQEET